LNERAVVEVDVHLQVRRQIGLELVELRAHVPRDGQRVAAGRRLHEQLHARLLVDGLVALRVLGAEFDVSDVL
jgi:hypothetical protein